MAAMVCCSAVLPLSIRIKSCDVEGRVVGWQQMRTSCTFARRNLAMRRRAGGNTGVEPDLQEDDYDVNATAGSELRDDEFPWGKADGAHSWHEGDDGTFMEGINEVMESSGAPTGGQGAMSWLFIPGLIAGWTANIPHEYLFIYTAVFVVIFVGIEMAKPAKETNFEPEMYRKKK
ncbi:unnamed protein product [Sphagnum balticum]